MKEKFIKAIENAMANMETMVISIDIDEGCYICSSFCPIGLEVNDTSVTIFAPTGTNDFYTIPISGIECGNFEDEYMCAGETCTIYITF